MSEEVRSKLARRCARHWRVIQDAISRADDQSDGENSQATRHYVLRQLAIALERAEMLRDEIRQQSQAIAQRQFLEAGPRLFEE